MLLSLEVLRRYCQLGDRCIDFESPGPGSPGIMDDPANLLSLSCTAHTKFDMFALCFEPAQVRFSRLLSPFLQPCGPSLSHDQLASRTRT